MGRNDEFDVEDGMAFDDRSDDWSDPDDDWSDPDEPSPRNLSKAERRRLGQALWRFIGAAYGMIAAWEAASGAIHGLEGAIDAVGLPDSVDSEEFGEWAETFPIVMNPAAAQVEAALDRYEAAWAATRTKAIDFREALRIPDDSEGLALFARMLSILSPVGGESSEARAETEAILAGFDELAAAAPDIRPCVHAIRRAVGAFRAVDADLDALISQTFI